MCHTIATRYKFCGCNGNVISEECSEKAKCVFIQQPRLIYLHCYCDRHATTKFTTVYDFERKRAKKKSRASDSSGSSYEFSPLNDSARAEEARMGRAGKPVATDRDADGSCSVM